MHGGRQTDESSADERDNNENENLSRRDVLTPFIQSSVSALGGFITGDRGRVYEMGDSCLGCLRDLKKFWRKDDMDDDRTVARIFWETRALPNDLVPILLETAGKGAVTDKRALACADLITAMTWPIDVAEELQELDDELDAKTDYTTLLHAQLSYKAALLQPSVLKSLLNIMAPSLAKTKRDRTEKDNQIINVVLHAFRNLAFIKDLPPNAFKSADRVEYSSLQSKMITIMKDTHILDVFTTLAANSANPAYNPFNAVLLEIYYLLLRGVKPQQLILDPEKQSNERLKSLLDVEARSKQHEQRQRASRHSRFGTTVTIRSGNDQYIVHKQSGITADASTVMARSRGKPARRVKRQDELASFEDLSTKALGALQDLAVEFMDSCFEEFFSSLLKDIKAERAKITESDNIRLLAVVKWFLEFFLAARGKELNELRVEGVLEPEYDSLRWRFEMVSEVVERSWVGWVLRRMRMAMDDKPKQWTELRAGMDCLSQLLILLDQMSLSESPDFAHEASQSLQHQLYYSGEILEISFDGLKGYKEQSIAYLDSSVHLAYLILRMLERWAKTKGEMYVRKTVKAKRKSKKGQVKEGEGVVDVDSDDEETSRPGDSMWNEHMFTFEKYESKFAQEDITRACLAYLERYREFDSPDQMKRVVSLMHRQAVKVKAEGLFFKVTTLELFNRILDDQKALPRDAAYKELIQMVNFILRKFFKTVGENPFLVVEAFYPKNRGQWKQYSTFVPETKGSATQGTSKGKRKRAAADVEIKKGYSDEEKLGIAIALLVQQDKMQLVEWVRTTLMTVLGLRLATINEVRREMEASGVASAVSGTEDAALPSAEAMSKIEDYSIPYVKEEQAEAATKDPYLKLVLRLIDCYVVDHDADELEWYFPAAVTPDDLQKHLDLIARYLDEPIDLGGKAPSEVIQKKRAARAAARRTRRSATATTSSSDEAQNTDDELLPKKRRTKRKKEEIQYKSAEFIEDSDIDPEADAEFLAKEEELRRRTEAAAGLGQSATMRATGTKKRKRGGKDPSSASQETGNPSPAPHATARSSRKRSKPSQRGSRAEQHSAEDEGPPPTTSTVKSSSEEPQPRPRPRPRYAPVSRATTSSPASSPVASKHFTASSTAGSDAEAPRSTVGSDDDDRVPDADEVSDDSVDVKLSHTRRTSRRKTLVFSDDEEV